MEEDSKASAASLLRIVRSLNRQERDFIGQEGLPVRAGQWTKAEINQLNENVTQVCREKGFQWFKDLVYDKTSKGKEKRAEMQLYAKLGKGINRPLFLIYRKVKRAFDELNFVGAYSKEESERLLALVKIHGNKWVTIGQIMERSAASVNHRATKMKNEVVKGPWTAEELGLLKKGVDLAKEGKDGNIHWTMVSDHVKTRNADSCRIKWLNEFCWKPEWTNGDTVWSKQATAAVIIYLRDMSYEDEKEIDWEKLVSDMRLRCSGPLVRYRWQHVKHKVPKFQIMELPEILDYLAKHYVYFKPQWGGDPNMHWNDILTEEHDNPRINKALKTLPNIRLKDTDDEMGLDP